MRKGIAALAAGLVATLALGAGGAAGEEGLYLEDAFYARYPTPPAPPAP